MFRESYENNVQLTSLQKQYKTEWDRSLEIRKGTVVRNTVGLAFLPSRQQRIIPVGRGQRIEYYHEQIRPDRPFIYNKKVDIVTCFDVPNYRKSEHANVKAMALQQSATLSMRSGKAAVGPTRRQVKVSLDFHRKPRQPYQPTIQLTENYRLSWPVSGDAFIQTTDEHYMFCCGRLNRKGVHPDALVVHFAVARSLFDGSVPVASLTDDVVLPQNSGGILRLGRKLKGEVAVLFSQPSVYEQTIKTEGKHVLTHPKGMVMSTANTDLFKVLNAINKRRNDIALSPEEVDPAMLVEPREWTCRPMVEFDTESLERRLSLKGYYPPKELRRSALRAVGPEGTFRIKRRHSQMGMRVMRNKATGLKHVQYDNGDRQPLPPSFVMGPERQHVGEYCPRKLYTWEEFTEVMGDYLPLFIRDLVMDLAIKPGFDGWDGTGVLLDSRYCIGLQDCAQRDIDGSVKWYWDVRNAMKYLDKTTGALICPSIMVSHHEDCLNLPDVRVHLGHSSKPGSNRHKYRKRSSGSNKQVMSGAK